MIIREMVTFILPEKISISNGVGINYGCWFNGWGEIKLEENALIGPYTVVHSANHVIPHKPKQIKNAGWEGKKVELRKNSWVGAGCLILAGAEIGEGSVIGAGGVVTGEIEDFSIAVGVPAKVIKQR